MDFKTGPRGVPQGTYQRPHGLASPVLPGRWERACLQQVCRWCEIQGSSSSPGGCAALQRDLARLGKWASSHLVKFSQGKCKVLHLGRNNSFAEKTMGHTKLTWAGNVSLWARRPAASWIELGRVGWGRWSFPSRGTWKHWSNQGLRARWGEAPYEERLRGAGPVYPGEEKAQGDLVCKYLAEGRE